MFLDAFTLSGAVIVLVMIGVTLYATGCCKN
ncbi:hypothetical protein DFR30_1815 [Thiogranum longum]|uniref:Uncharacterized protein n=1 Tax=Thiogranum longum TaxID=1537524 RepID=A0A4R1H9H1_9GAMM|nr:hypothetical protein DFR30_1815 [Thiogranum longum]